ncbi:MAG TPA: type II toxin-antitoxin system Phd/YefM family antitoxin [Bryobacteraceae bacterium]|nr:type II toxin-antitoxin system Phd/YefM family antitoxin [Bryobacteraceae bacterium]
MQRGTWPVQDAKARFSELLEASLKYGPQTVTKRGVEAAVLVPIDEWNRIKDRRATTLKELLLSPEPRIDFAKFIPKRGRSVRRRPGVKFD